MARRLFNLFWIGFFFINLLAFIHAYKFTHFSSSAKPRTKDPKELSALTKTRVLFTGIDNPKPIPAMVPATSFKTIQIESDVKLEAWHIKTASPKGTVILFHGYSGEKSSLITRAEHFARLGYNTLLVDFMGSGGSEGDGTTIGYAEAREVKDVYAYVATTGEKNIHLFGTSMGAVAILKALRDYEMQPTSIILECPFGSFYKTVCARFDMMNVPSFPMAGILTFWGGFQQGYWYFGHNPSKYALSVNCPTLLLFGEEDDRVSMNETQKIYQNLAGPKTLVTYPGVGHLIYTEENAAKWFDDVSSFLENVPQPELNLSYTPAQSYAAP